MKRCKTCKWRGVEDRNNAGAPYRPGYLNCRNPKLNGDTTTEFTWDSDGAIDGEEWNGFWTGPDFGCIHHEE